MIVTAGIERAMQYKVAFDAYLRERKSPFQAIVAFSGEHEFGVSPTYLCRVEQCGLTPPTADRVRRMAELLEESPDQWIALAGRAADDLSAVLAEAPVEILQIIYAMRGMTPQQLDQLRRAADRIAPL